MGLESILILVLKAAGTAAATVVTTYLPRLFRAAERRLGGKLPDDWQRNTVELATASIAYGEEWAHEKIKGGEKAPSSEKLKAGIAFFKQNAKGAAKRLAEEKIAALIKSQLTKTRTK